MENTIKILYITNGVTGTGGLERVLSIKASYLADHYGYEVHILSLNETEATPFYTFSKKVHFHSISVYGNPWQYLRRYVNGIKKAVQDVKPDVISVCDDGLKGFFLPFLIGQEFPLVYERHASIQLNFSVKGFSQFRQRITHRLMRWLGKKFDAFVVLTNGNVKEWSSKNVTVIPNTLSFYPHEVSSLDNKRVTAVGTHSFNKGYDLLLNAWQQVLVDGYDWKLYILGKHEHTKTFVNMAKAMDIDEHVVFSPPVSDILSEYQNSSIHVLPSRSEGFGMVLIEAMACGVPCVAFDCPHGPADIIKDGEDGVLVEAEDINNMAAAIIRLIQDKELRIQMGTKARQNVKRYLPDNVVPIWDQLFKQLVAENKA